MNSSQQQPRKAQSLAHYIARGARRALVAMCLVGSFAVVQHFMPVPMEYAPHQSSPAAPAATLPADCWDGEAPADMAGQIPGHVFVTVDGETRKGGSRMVGKALAQVFDGADHGLTVHGFCR